MRDDVTVLIFLSGCLLTSCITATREREARCLAATMTDVWQTEHELTSAEQAWHTAQAQIGQTAGRRSLLHPVPIVDRDVPSFDSEHAALRRDRQRGSSTGKDDTLYRRVVAAHARHGEAIKWHRLVAGRVQTRIEEDEMLYPVLGMLATSTAIVLYPVVRWNVRTLLWDGTDPDADDDPIQTFCVARLGGQHSTLRP